MEATVAGREAGPAEGGRSRRAVGTPRFESPAELREVLEALLTTVDADDRTGTLVRAAGPRIRFEFTDRGVILNLAAADGRDHNLRWRFDDEVGWEPRLRMWMDSAVANRYLQGRESLAIAIARGRVRYEGDARGALLYLPAMRFFVEPYRRLVRDRFPRLAIASAAA